MASGVKMVRDDVAKIMRDIKKLTELDVLVGIPSDKTDREDGSPMNNAILGYIHEYGAPAAGIPARPFLIPGVQNAQPKVIKHLEAAAKAALEQKPDDVDVFLHRAGGVATNEAKAVINAGVKPDLKDATLAARRRRGRTGEVPLIDIGKLRNSITYVVRKK